MYYRIAPLLLAFILFNTVNAYDVKGKVTSVIDGDTIKVKPPGKSEIKVRITLIDTPEIGEDGYYKAKSYTKEKCLGETAKLYHDTPKLDVYDRTLYLTFCDGINMNAKLIEKGLGTILTEYCDTSKFADETWASPPC